jgi:hypothetical protein
VYDGNESPSETANESSKEMKGSTTPSTPLMVSIQTPTKSNPQPAVAAISADPDLSLSQQERVSDTEPEYSIKVTPAKGNESSGASTLTRGGLSVIKSPVAAPESSAAEDGQKGTKNRTRKRT